ncbi:MAG: hypothetical protein IKU35_06670 [Bacteroidaceae bacterium]|nr:hypothetical protein [Bacteroidaceae bacterium]
MQIVCDIPDDFYERVNKDGCMSYTDAEVVVNAFYLGKALPKGHGRLIDENEILNNPDGIYYDLYDVPEYLEQCIPTVIEADKEGADE